MKVAGDEFVGGVGGTVAAIILRAEIMAANGWRVCVASAICRDFVFNGVRYRPLKTVEGGQYDALILINSWGETVSKVVARRKVFCYHDTRIGGSPDTARCVEWSDKTVVDSPFSAGRLNKVLSAESAGKIVAVPIPIRLQDYNVNVAKSGKCLLYSSMPDRGLVHLAKAFSAILARVPDAELHVTGDFSMYGWVGAKSKYEKHFANTRGVQYHGQVDRPTLVQLQNTARVLAFPCTFAEGFCISAAEAMAAGAVPVTSGSFALVTTVGSAGVLIPGHPGGGRQRILQRWLYMRRFVREVVRLLTDTRYWSRKSAECRESARNRYSADAWFKAFQPLVSSKSACG